MKLLKLQIKISYQILPYGYVVSIPLYKDKDKVILRIFFGSVRTNGWCPPKK